MKWLIGKLQILAFTIPALLAGATTATATPIDPGFDLFNTLPGTFVELDLGGGPIQIPLEGNTLGPGDTDTIVERKTGENPFPVGGSTTIDIELVALSLRSVDPVDIGGTLFDIDIISGTLLGQNPNPLGQMTVFHEHINGGTFIVDFLPIDFTAIITEIGNPFNQFNFLGSLQFGGSQGVWSHTPGPMDVHSSFLQAGGFYVGIDPETGEKVPITHTAFTPGIPADIPTAIHNTQAAMVPEPGTLALFGLGLLGICFFRQTRA